jgi:integrase
MATKLENGCYFTDLWVSPKNWNTLTSRKSLSLNWYVQCKFHDPLFKEKYPDGFPFRKKVNGFQTLNERKEAIELLLSEIPKLFIDKGYNPITKKYDKKIIYLDEELNETLPVMRAFRLALEKSDASEKHRHEIKVALNRFEKGLEILRLEDVKINDFSRRQLKITLDRLNLPSSYFNKFKTYLSSLFGILLEYECCETNLARDIIKKKTTQKIRKTLSDSEFKRVLGYLQENHSEFHRYMMIFFYSGGRSAELLRLKKSDVNLEKQEYKVLIKKGKQYKEVIKIIIPASIPFWQEILDLAKDDDFLFSKKLLPGKSSIMPYQITLRWKRHVKNKLGITADFYSLKHLFLDLIDQTQSGQNLSSKLASHTTSTITNSVYLVGKKDRENEILKHLKFGLIDKISKN